MPKGVRGKTMVRAYDVDQHKLVLAIAAELKKSGVVTMPSWALFVKTGVSKERPPVEVDWWYIRAASILRKLYVMGPIGVSKLRTKYGGKKNRGVKPEEFRKASGKVIRVILQQLEKGSLVKQQDKTAKEKGRRIAPKGVSLVDKAAGTVFAPAKKSKSQETSKDAPQESPAVAE